MDESPENLNPRVEEPAATDSEPDSLDSSAEETVADSSESVTNHTKAKCNPLLRILTDVFIIAALGILVSFVPRFWAGGPSVTGGLLASIPAALSLLLSKESLGNVSPYRKNAKDLFESFGIQQSYHEKILFIGSLSFLGAVWSLNCFSPQIAEKFYYKPAEETIKSGIAKVEKLSGVEAQLKVAIALKPDYADAHFRLGWLYELRQDLSAAISEYKLAMQNGSTIARIRLASLYLFDVMAKDDESLRKEGDSKPVAEGVDTKVELDTVNVAAIVLMQAYKQIYDLPEEDGDWPKDKKAQDKVTAFPASDKYYDCQVLKIFRSAQDCEMTNIQLLKRSYYVALAWARVEQERYEGATGATLIMDRAIEENKKIKNRFEKTVKEQVITDLNTDPPLTILYCVNAELLDRQSKSKPLEFKTDQIRSEWAKCRDSIGPVDPSQDPWLRRAYKKLKLLAKGKGSQTSTEKK